MAKKKTDTSSTTTEAATETRKKKVLSPVAQELLDTATANVTAAKAQIKSAKALGKVVECVSIMDAWGIEQLNKAIVARQETLAIVKAE